MKKTSSTLFIVTMSLLLLCTFMLVFQINPLSAQDGTFPTAKLIREYKGSYSAFFAPDGKSLYTLSYGSIDADLSNVETGEKISRVSLPKSVSYAGFSVDGKYLYGVDYSKIGSNSKGPVSFKLVDPGTGSIIQSLDGQSGFPYRVSLSPDNKWFAASADDAIRVWDTTTGNITFTMPIKGQALGLAFSPDSKILLSGLAQKITVWDVVAGKSLREFSVDGYLYSLAFLPSGQSFIAGTNTGWQHRRLENGTVIKTAGKPLSGGTYSLALSSDGKQLLVSEFRNLAWLYDVETAQPLRIFPGHANFISSVAFSADDKYILTISSDGSLESGPKLWDSTATGTPLTLKEAIPPTTTPRGKQSDSSSSSSATRTPSLTPLPAVLSQGQILYRDGSALSIVNASGKNEKKFGDDRRFIYLCPAWSRDGKQVAVLSGSEGFELHLLDASGNGQHPLVKRLPTLTPNPSKTTQAAKAPTAVRTPLPSPTFTVTSVDVPGGSVSWSPDGKEIAFTGQNLGDFYVITADGKSTRSISGASFINIDWSPDGQEFVAFARPKAGKPGLYILKTDGSDLKLLLELPESDWSHSLNAENFFTRSLVTPRWSPDGKQITFASTLDSENFSLYIMNADGSNRTRLTNGSANDYAPSWSPDGNFLAFASDRNGSSGIYTVETASKGVLPAVSLREGGCPVWRPTTR
jgi:Tol biopolymer transport system component